MCHRLCSISTGEFSDLRKREEYPAYGSEGIWQPLPLCVTNRTFMTNIETAGYSAVST